MFSKSVLAAEAKPNNDDNSTGFEYPELLVTPSASERLKEEAVKEQDSRWRTHTLLQVPALVTLVAGGIAYTDPGEERRNEDGPPMVRYASYLGIAVGGGWLALTSILSGPYQEGVTELGKHPPANNSKRERLQYERRAEEVMTKAGRLGFAMKTVSIVSNVLAGGLILSSGKRQSTQVMGAATIVTALMPIFFEHSWSQVSGYHEDYKKRIFGPLAATILFDEESKQLTPGFTYSLAI